MELPEREEDADIAEQVVKIINGYANYTLWDYLDGSINEGVVTLFGSVTPDRDKKGELYAQIAKIRGVQDYVDNIEIQSSSIGDERLRSTLQRSIFSSEHFERYRSATPPFHIVVNQSTVRLVGYVPTQIEYLEMQRIVTQTQGVLRVENELQTLR